MSYNVEFPIIKHKGIQQYLEKYKLITPWEDRPTFDDFYKVDYPHKVFKNGSIYIDSNDYRDFLEKFCGKENILKEDKLNWKEKQLELPDDMFKELYSVCFQGEPQLCNQQAFKRMVEYNPSLVRYVDIVQAIFNVSNLFVLYDMIDVWPLSAYFPVSGYNGITLNDRIYPYHIAKWRWKTINDSKIQNMLRRLEHLTPPKYRALNELKINKIKRLRFDKYGKPIVDVNLAKSKSKVKKELGNTEKDDTKKSSEDETYDTETDDEDDFNSSIYM